MTNSILKFLGPLLAVAGVLGLTGSSILWNFQGRNLGLPATVFSLVILAVGIVLLRPLQPVSTAEDDEITEVATTNTATIMSSDELSETQNLHNVTSAELEQRSINSNPISSSDQNKSSMTTAEAIAAQLAKVEAHKPEPMLVNFAPEALRPGNSLKTSKRAPGRNMSMFRDMASDLFKTN